MRLPMVLLSAMAIVSGCVSPEATRTRGGGPGADPQNRTADVKMHEGSRQYWKTPVMIEANHPPLDAAQQAQARSLR